jgi:hypothetical protein
MKQDNQNTWSHDRIQNTLRNLCCHVDEVDRYLLAESVYDRHIGCQWNKRKEDPEGLEGTTFKK